MVAVTVVLGATVYAAVNAYGSTTGKDPASAAFKAQGTDTNNNNRLDSLKLTYLAGPSNVPNADVLVNVRYAANGTVVAGAFGHTGPWNPGDIVVYSFPGAGSFFITVSLQGVTLVDQTTVLDE